MRLARVAPFAPPFVCVVCFLLDLLGALLPAVPVPILQPVTCVFFSAARYPRPLICTVCSYPFPRCLLALCCAPSGGALWFYFFFLVCPPPLSLCATCLVVSCPCRVGFFLPSSLHARTSALHWSSGHCSPRCSSPVPSPSRGVPLGRPRPSQVGAPPLRHSPLLPLRNSGWRLPSRAIAAEK